MLVSFSLKNWMSFRDQVKFSMVATRERHHGQRLPRLDKYRTRILPVAAIYGGNASGKTNFCAALAFAQRLILLGTRPDERIPVEPFRLDTEGGNQTSRFGFELLIDERIYEFSFAVTHEVILEEKLVEITSASEKVLYHRRDGEPGLHPSLAKDQRLKFTFQGTRDNQLFLTNSVSQQVDRFRPVYDWFRNTLTLVSPSASFGPIEQFFDEKSPLHLGMSETLSQLDTGIEKLGSEEIPFEKLPIPEEIRTRFKEEVMEGSTARLPSVLFGDEFCWVARKENELIAYRLVSSHRTADGTLISFRLHQESSGSQRLINLLPAFLELSRQPPKRSM